MTLICNLFVEWPLYYAHSFWQSLENWIKTTQVREQTTLVLEAVVLIKHPSRQCIKTVQSLEVLLESQPFADQQQTSCDWLVSHCEALNWLSWGFTSHPTQNRSFRKRSYQPIFWLSTEKLNQTQQKQTCIHNKIYHKTELTQKTKAKFGRLLRPPAWKPNWPILERVDKSGSKWVRK